MQTVDDPGLARFLPDLRAAAARLTGSSQEADDLVQDCLASAVEGADRMRHAGLLGAWLHQILRRRWYDQLRRRMLERRVRIEASPVCDDPAREIVHRALEGLDADSRRVLRMRFFESRTSVEIGRALGKPAGTIRSMIFHSLRKFEAEFKRLCPQEER